MHKITLISATSKQLAMSFIQCFFFKCLEGTCKVSRASSLPLLLHPAREKELHTPPELNRPVGVEQECSKIILKKAEQHCSGVPVPPGWVLGPRGPLEPILLHGRCSLLRCVAPQLGLSGFLGSCGTFLKLQDFDLIS